MNHQPEPALRRILVVDDNPSIHEDFRKILCPQRGQSTAALDSMAEELFGSDSQDRPGGRFELDSAYQGQEALDMVKRAELEGRPYSLAFMDVRMPPGWDGIETITHIWKEHPQVQIVICTAYSDYSWDQILQKLGETESLVILKKPFDNVEVLQLAHTLTKKWMVTRQANARMADLDETVRQRTRELLDANQELQNEIKRRSVTAAALRESEERFHRAFETVAVPLAIRPLDTCRYLDVNESFAELCGYTKAEIIGKKPEELQLLVDSARYSEHIASLREGRKIRNVEVSIRRKNGEVRQVLVSVEILQLGPQPCLLVALQDVTEQRKLESQLRQSQKMEAIGLLAAGVAHDFNNLLTIIQGHSSLQLTNKSLDKNLANVFSVIQMASERGAALTRQLLAFSRQHIVRRRPLDLAAAITQVSAMLSRTLGETIQLECRLAPNLPCVHADPTDFDQVIMNLALNARDAMPEGGKLTLSTASASITQAEAADNLDKRAGEFVALTVTDTGCGMNKETLSRIFEPFFTTKPLGHGTGLGLSSVYGIVKQHEGWIEVESQPGIGTSFRVFLPVSSQSPEIESSPTSVPPGESSSPSPEGAVFVVEDEPAVREFVTTLLTEEGYTVFQASSGADALLKWKSLSDKTRLLLTDMVMPGGISGTMLAKKLLSHHPHLRVIYTSGYSPDVVANGHSLQEGVNFLSKPYNQAHLLATIQNAFNSPASALELDSVGT